MRTRFATLPARSVRYLEAGSGAPLILIHAFPLNAEQWLPQLARAAPGCRVVAPDVRGFAGSEPYAGLPSADVTMETYARDVLELMTHLEIERAVVCGISMGGYVAFAMLRQAPRRIAGLVLADTRAEADTEEGRTGRDRMLDRLGAEGTAGVADAMLPRLLGETTRREQPDLEDVVRRLIMGNDVEGVAAAIRAMKGRPDSTPDLAAVACPALIVCGEEDAITPPAVAAAMRDAIAGSRLVSLARAGHLSNLEAPFAFNDALFPFVLACGPDSTPAWPPARRAGPR